ncbi:MAG: ankyrin repeat domain-containing protein [Sphingobacteriales bacterium]|jgi:ankyrin repeat protein
MRAADYIEYWEESDNSSEELEKEGFTIYSSGDGTYYAVHEESPEEAHHLASGASQGCDMSLAVIDGDIVKAAYDGNEELVEMLLGNGVSPDKQNGLGETALHNAAMVGYANICTLLLDRGASINLPDKEGNTPLDVAISSEDEVIASLLRARGGATQRDGKSHL